MRRLFFLVSIFFFPLPLFAATVSFGVPQEVHQGDVVTVQVTLSEGEGLNALAGTVRYDRSLFQLENVNEGSSPITFWLTSPQTALSAPHNEGTIDFSGITPGGFGVPLTPSASGETLFTASFLAQGTGEVEFTLVAPEAYKNDGQATAVPVSIIPSRVVIQPALDTTPQETHISEDLTPPLVFIPLLSQDPALENGKWFLAFSTRDGESGIDHYEVKEGFGAFMPATSPYVLHDQSRRFDVFVRAYDRAGNMTTVQAVSGRVSRLFLPGSCILSVITLLVCFLVWRKSRSRVA